MELFKKYRPKRLEEVIGAEGSVPALKNMLSRGTLPHTVLFHGPSGCGKTTLARILRRELGCNSMDFRELNCSDFRGIDTIRDIARVMNLAPTAGKCRIWLLDECFAKGTLVDTPNGRTPIEMLSKNSPVFSNGKVSYVEQCFRNQVKLNRIVRLSFSNGISIITTKQHQFMTDTGWKQAQNLTKKDFLFSIRRYRMLDRNFLRRMNNAKKPSVVPTLWEGVLGLAQQQKTILFKKLSGQKQINPSRNPSTNVQCESAGKNSTSACKISPDFEREVGSPTIFLENEISQSYDKPFQYTKRLRNKKNQRNPSYLAFRKGRQWKINCSTNYAGVNFGMENGSGRISWSKNQRISNVLQVGCGKYQIKNWNRSRWTKSSISQSTQERQEKRRQIKAIRLESIEIYQPGNNEQSFQGVIGDKERHQGYATFYDLQIAGHPSYYVEGLMVHNCHALSKDGQNAALKMLEDTPDHVYFFLCTTDPNKLLKTILNRCCEMPVRPLTYEELETLLKRTAKVEGITIGEKALDEVIWAAQGSARSVLVLLDKIRNMDEKEILKSLERKLVQENEAIDLCRALIKKEPWQKVAGILKNLKGEPEQIRWAVMGYARAVLLKSKEPQAYFIITCFRDNFYDSKEAGLACACYECLFGE